MSVDSIIETLQRRINALRVQNSETRKFVPEKELYELMSKAVISEIVATFIPSFYQDEMVQFIFRGARKVFGILILINKTVVINSIVRRDQMQSRRMDDLLPFTKPTLKTILEDEYITELFYEKQWEFCSPVFSGEIMPRSLDPETILPFLTEKHVSNGGFGSVYQIVIYPSHRPLQFKDTTLFVRKALHIEDKTYANEVRVLSMLQRLKHPNILKLIACYTHNFNHNLVSPYITGGNLKTFLKQPKRPNMLYEEMLYSMAGLASAIYALHEFFVGDLEPSHKGHHQDLQPENILVEGNRFVLADFGLSSIKSMKDDSNTNFRGRKGYCQAPESAELTWPYQEHKITRAADIFALGCIFADLIVYQLQGTSGVDEFRQAREFHVSQIRFYLFHKGHSPNEAVEEYLIKTASQCEYDSASQFVRLILDMLEIFPTNRPSAMMVTTRLYTITIKAFSEDILSCFKELESSSHASYERARFVSWVSTQDVDLYSTLSGATTTGKVFDGVIDILRDIKAAVQELDKGDFEVDARSFSEISMLNTQLLNMLSPEKRSKARSHMQSVLVSICIESSAITDSNEISQIHQIAATRELVAQVEGSNNTIQEDLVLPISGVTKHKRKLENYELAEVDGGSEEKPDVVIIEKVQYQDSFRRQLLKPRMSALSKLLANSNSNSQLRIPPFCGIYDNSDDFCFEILYSTPKQNGDDFTHSPSSADPVSLHKLLQDRNPKDFPTLEGRFKLAIDLAESVLAFHDYNWFHKDLTSWNVWFFPEISTSPSACAKNPFLLGFQHSRNANDYWTEGPLQDKQHRRYHHPQYLSKGSHHFTRFHPQFDYYSLGILLIEIGFWDTIVNIMDKSKGLSNNAFYQAIIEHKLSELTFYMGSAYAEVVKNCIMWQDPAQENAAANIASSLANLSFRENVVTQLRSIEIRQRSSGLIGKRKIQNDRKDNEKSVKKRVTRSNQ